MRAGLLLAVLAIGLNEASMQSLLQQAFYPVLFFIFVIASLGLPIPEDLPLIAAGVVLATQSPDAPVASWTLTIIVSLCGIMSGDMVLYSLGRRWGRDLFEHRFVSWLITPARMERMTEQFHRWGVWACFFGRFMMGVRAIMCLTAGVTRFPFFKFLLADFAGALLSAPLFIVIGYLCAGIIDQIKPMIAGFQTAIGAVVVLVIGGIIAYEVRRMKRMHAESQAAMAQRHESPEPSESAGDADPKSRGDERRNPVAPGAVRPRPNAT